jgi:hypothetical protein
MRALLFAAIKVTRYGWPAGSCAGASSRQVCSIDVPGACVKPNYCEVRVAGILPPEALF